MDFQILRKTIIRKLLSSLFVFFSIHVYLVMAFFLFHGPQSVHDYVIVFLGISIPSIFIYAPLWSLLSDYFTSLVTTQSKTSVRSRGYSLLFHLLGGLVVLFFISPVFIVFSIIGALIFWIFDSYLLESTKKRCNPET